jgi:NAD(P)-dependent dehydrogenase (short-subunit alcohol dehydrogenase family)
MRVIPLQLDVTKPSESANAAAIAKDITLLVNNAGLVDFGSVLDAPFEVFRRNIDVNFYGILHTTRAFSPILIENKGSVVNLLTIVAMASMPSLGVYNASKAAAWSLTQSLRADFAKRGVHVFGVFPGAVDTDMIRRLDIPKTPARTIADAIIAGIEAGTEDIFPDSGSRDFYNSWVVDHKAIERYFASM